VDAGIEDGNDVRVVEVPGDAGFLFESPRPVGVARNGCAQHFDRDLALKLRIAGAIDVAHAASAQRAENLEPTESVTHRDAHGCEEYRIPVRREQ
jgi:hypothetical protein